MEPSALTPTAHDRIGRELREHDAPAVVLAAWASVNTDQPTRGDQITWAYVLAHHKTLTRSQSLWHAPPSLPGPITLPLTLDDGTPVHVSPATVATHTLITGPTGVGKTSLGLQLGRALTPHLRLILHDPKHDAQGLVLQDPRVIVWTPEAPIDVLSPPSWSSAPDHVALLTRCFGSAMYCGELQQQVLEEALHHLLARPGTPSLGRLIEQIERLHTPRDSWSRRDAIAGVARRLRRLLDHYPGLGTPTHSLDVLLERGFHLSALSQTGTTDFLFHYALERLYRKKHAQQDFTPTHYVYIEEALKLLADNPLRPTIAGHSLFSEAFQVYRELGICLALSTTSLALTDRHLRTNAGTLIILRPYSSADLLEASKALLLNRDQTEALRRLSLGECLIRLPHHHHALHARFASLEAAGFTKRVSSDQWHTCTQRLAQLPPNDTLAPRIADSHDASITATVQTAHDISTTTTSAIVVDETTPIPDTPPHVEPTVALLARELVLLRVVAGHLLPSTVAYRRAGLSLAAGDAARDKLVLLGLAAVARVATGRGRGRTSMITRPTTSGYERAGVARPRLLRGNASIASAYYTQEFLAFLPWARSEVMIGTKSVDLILPPHNERHTFLGRAALCASEFTPLPSLTPTGLVALELETSDRPLPTARANVEHNHAAGIPLTIIAVLPRHVRSIAMAMRDRERVAVVDLLGLLDALRA